jgi:hypothetical protein
MKKLAALVVIAIGFAGCTTPPTSRGDVPDEELLRRVLRPKPTYPECLSPDCAQLLAQIRMPGDPYVPSIEQQKQWCRDLCGSKQDIWQHERRSAIEEYNRRHPTSIIVPVDQ